MTRKKLTTLIGSIVGTIIVILNLFFGVDIPPEMTTTIIGLLVAIIGFIWKPDEKPEK